LVGGLTSAHAQQAPSGYLSLEQYDSARQKPAEAKASVVYEAVRGASLRATLEHWAALSGWQPLAWKLPEETDFTLGASARFEGDFITATRAFVASLGPEAVDARSIQSRQPTGCRGAHAMKKTALSLAGLAVLAGCATPTSYETRTELRTQISQKAQELQAVPSVVAPVPRVVESEQAYIPVIARKVSEHAWLRAMRVTVQTGKDPVPMAEILRALAKQGVSITSEMPLDRFQYSGFSLVDVDAESALRSVVTSVGLDYQADAQRRVVVIKPMSSRTWYLNIGNRRSSFAAGGNNTATPSTTNAIANAISQSGSGGGSSQQGNSAVSSGKTEVTSSDDFWTSLKTELDSRLKLMLPDPPKPAAAAPVAQAIPAIPSLPLPPVVAPPGQPQVANAAGAPGAPAQAAPVPATPQNLTAALPNPTPAPSSDGILSYTARQVGSYAVNPETGAVSVQAPHWVLQDLDSYFKRVSDMYNTDIVFQGELIMLTTDTSRSEGLDISSFAKFANSKYGVVYRNNGLGGVTVSFPNANSLIPAVTAGPGALAGPLFGHSEHGGRPADFQQLPHQPGPGQLVAKARADHNQWGTCRLPPHRHPLLQHREPTGRIGWLGLCRRGHPKPADCAGLRHGAAGQPAHRHVHGPDSRAD